MKSIAARSVLFIVLACCSAGLLEKPAWGQTENAAAPVVQPAATPPPPAPEAAAPATIAAPPPVQPPVSVSAPIVPPVTAPLPVASAVPLVPASVQTVPPPAPAPVAPLPLPSPVAPARIATIESAEGEYQNVRVQLSGAQEIQSVGDPFRLQVKVTNRTGDDIAVTKVRWELPRSVLATRPGEQAATAGIPWQQGIALAQPESLPNRSEQLFDLEMPAIHETWWNLPRNTRMMAFKPGEYPVKVRVEYAAGPNRRMSVAEETVRIRFDTTPWFYIWGGILGSMVGVLFEFFYTAARGLERYEWPKNERGRLAPGYVLRDAFVFLFRWVLGGTAKWLTGSLTAAIVLLFLYYYKDVHLPITIQINDFFGAVVVGLVAHRLGLWIFDTLFARVDKPVSGPPTGGGGPVPFGFPQQVVPALTYPER